MAALGHAADRPSPHGLPAAATGTGQGKLILFGEHAAVFGHPALGVQLPERTTVTIHGPRTRTWSLSEIHAEDRQIVGRVFDMLERLLPDLGSAGPRALRVESTVPRGVGLGSSAALCSAAAAAAVALVEGSGAPQPDRIWQLAHELERLFHGTPSGIDTGLSLHEGLSAYAPLPPALPRWERISASPLWLAVGALPRAGESAALIRSIGERMRAGEKRVSEALSALGLIAREAKQTLAAASLPGQAGRAAVIGGLADKAMDILRDLGLSNPDLDFLLDEGRRSGAFGGKLSGAGGGGAFFLVVENAEAARSTALLLEHAAGHRGIRFAASPRPLLAGS